MEIAWKGERFKIELSCAARHVRGRGSDWPVALARRGLLETIDVFYLALWKQQSDMLLVLPVSILPGAL
jgi:hypothetical protein